MICSAYHAAPILAALALSFFAGKLYATRRQDAKQSGRSYVSRLFRWDHSGYAAMIEAESRWTSGGSWSAGSQSRPAYLQISSRQAEALYEHHELHKAAAFVQLGSESSGDAATSSSNASASLKAHRGKTKFAATYLQGLGSQYIGQAGVGSTGCVAQPAGSLVQNAERAVKTRAHGGGEQTAQIRGAAKARQQGGGEADEEACQANDESNVWMVFDTGSTNLWVASTLCKYGPCTQQGRTRYNNSRSLTYKDPAKPSHLRILFGTGEISGPQGIDDFHVGPFVVRDQTFGLIASESGSVFDQLPLEGILGLAFPAMSANGVRPFFDTIIQQRVLGANNVFAFYFSPDDPSANAVFWGEIDPMFYKGPLEYFPVIEPYYWSLDLLSFKIGDEEYLAGKGVELDDTKYRAIVDTGTTFMTSEGDRFLSIISRLPNSPCDQMTNESHPPIVFRLKTADGQPRDFVLTKDQYMSSDSAGSSRCSPAFMNIPLPKKRGPGMILGEVFLRHYFAAFDRGDGDPNNAKVGFAPAAHGDGTNTRLRELTAEQPAFTKRL
eukprot:TRINITY_DN64933_c0_g1_i1.p1 TRINITY_DN64933_c0_g1~~TRINITY_DN64933_c0_g1_i1.p1  ORF type:complete len:552 (+),score=93.87 TRINITY_DN64933_c0_g1_i1:115-1770(+)